MIPCLLNHFAFCFESNIYKRVLGQLERYDKISPDHLDKLKIAVDPDGSHHPKRFKGRIDQLKIWFVI